MNVKKCNIRKSALKCFLHNIYPFCLAGFTVKQRLTCLLSNVIESAGGYFKKKMGIVKKG